MYAISAESIVKTNIAKNKKKIRRLVESGEDNFFETVKKVNGFSQCIILMNALRILDTARSDQALAEDIIYDLFLHTCKYGNGTYKLTERQMDVVESFLRPFLRLNKMNRELAA